MTVSRPDSPMGSAFGSIASSCGDRRRWQLWNKKIQINVGGWPDEDRDSAPAIALKPWKQHICFSCQLSDPTRRILVTLEGRAT